MIKIRKGNDEKVVTYGLFEELYSGMGYEIVGEKTQSKPQENKEPSYNSSTQTFNKDKDEKDSKVKDSK